jgi:hypothetical protein
MGFLETKAADSVPSLAPLDLKRNHGCPISQEEAAVAAADLAPKEVGRPPWPRRWQYIKPGSRESIGTPLHLSFSALNRHDAFAGCDVRLGGDSCELSRDVFR